MFRRSLSGAVASMMTLLFAAGIFSLAQSAAAADEIQITNTPTNQVYPAISGNKIVWNEYRNGSNDIYMYDLGTQTETRISNGFGYYQPAIDGNKIVWEDYRHDSGGSGSEVYMYDLATQTETRITNNSTYDSNPSISGDKIVWMKHISGGNTDIYLYDLATQTEIPISTHTATQYYPKISGDKIVWQDYRNFFNGYFNPNIYMYDLATNTETRITTNMAGQEHAAIFGSKIVWQDYRNMRDNDNSDIYMYDLTTQTETRITNNTRGQNGPSIFENRIIWTDNRNNNGDIYLYDLTTQIEERITGSIADARGPKLNGGKVVSYDYRSGNADVYLYDLNPNASPIAEIAPVGTITLGQAASFDGSASSDSDGTIASYNWGFGDGSSGEGETVSHTYAVAGTYIVTLTVTDDDSATATDTVSVLINTLPIAAIAPVAEVNLGQGSNFDGSGSTDPDGTIVSYQWSYGDGATGTGATSSHTYASIGTFQAMLTVTDEDGGTDIETVSVAVNAPPVAHIAPVAPIIAGETASFNGSGSLDSDGTIASYVWDFGNGTNSTGISVSHEYATAGTYQVMLTVADNDGATDTASVVLVVQTTVQAIGDLMDLVESMNLARGISNSLDAKLENAAEALEAANSGEREDAINKLEAFISAVQAQSGNQLTVAQANELIAAANRIIAAID